MMNHHKRTVAGGIAETVTGTNSEENTMNSTKMLFANLLNDESGQDLIEYALIAALIALGAITIMGSLGKTVSNVFTSVNAGM
jgi:pilus assembly protein Flp/PilA